MPSASHIAHAGLPFANPISPAAMDAVIAAMPLGPGARILDTGCGNGEILARVLEAHPGTSGLGLDLDADAIADAQRRTADLAAQFELRDGTSVDEPFDALVNVGASHVYGDYKAALATFRALAPVVLYGEGFWQQPPTPAFLGALGGATEDELPDLEGLRAAIQGAGFTIAAESLASAEDWVKYEETLAANAERHGAPESLAYAQTIRERRALPGGTGTLGFGIFVLVA